MNGLLGSSLASAHVPVLVSHAGERACILFLEFFTANICNLNTQRAYARAVSELLIWCAAVGVPSLAAVAPLHVSTWIELQTQRWRPPRSNRDWRRSDTCSTGWSSAKWCLITRLPPCAGPAIRLEPKKLRCSIPAEARQLLDSIDVSTPAGLRDRALIALMVFDATLAMRVEDVYTQNRRLWVCLGGKSGNAPTVRAPSAGEQIYQTRCSSCHTLGDTEHAGMRSIGPDLLGVTRQRARLR